MACEATNQHPLHTRDTALEFDIEEHRIPDQEPLLGQETTFAEPSLSFELAECSSSSLPHHQCWRNSGESAHVRDKIPSSKKSSCRRNPMRILIGLVVALVVALPIIILLASPRPQSPLGMEKIISNWGKPGTDTENLAWYPTDFTKGIEPVPCHSHNDYWRKVPLFSALQAGCVGVEADVWLIDGDLKVGHNRAALQRHRTFRSLYIDPIVGILKKQNPLTEFSQTTNHGVFDEDHGQTLVLLVDLKTDGKETWPVVLEQLKPLRERGWLSYVKDDKLHIGPVTVVGTGNTPFDMLIADSAHRDAFFDAPLDRMWEREADEADENAPTPSATRHNGLTDSRATGNEGQGLTGVTETTEFSTLNSYYASVSFGRVIGEIQRGEFSAQQLDLIRGHVRGAHRRGLKVRYWNTPAWPIALRNHVWRVLKDEGADVLNVDDLDAATRGDWSHAESHIQGAGVHLAVMARNMTIGTVKMLKRRFK